MSRYTARDVRCPRCSAPPGRSCSLLQWLPELVVVVAGRVRRQRAGWYPGRELRQPHEVRRQAARRANARRAARQ